MLFMLVFFGPTLVVKSEGSGTWGTASTRQNWLWVPGTGNTGTVGAGSYRNRGYMMLPSNTASYNANHRLYVYVKQGETVYWGFHATVVSTNLRVRWYYDNRASAIGQFFPSVTTTTSGQGRTLIGTMASYTATGNSGTVQGRPRTAAEAAAGPTNSPLSRAGGYNAFSFTNTTGGDRAFWVEISNTSDVAVVDGFNIDFWDITVANGATEIQGRVYSKFWSISNSRTTNTETTSSTSFSVTSGSANNASFQDNFGFFVPVDNTFSAQVDDYFVKRIRVPGGSGGWTNFFANEHGPINTGTYLENRRSRSGTSTNLQYPLFLNDPDPTVWKTTVPPTASLSIDYREKAAPQTGGEAIVDLTISLPGVVDILVDLNSNDVYDQGVDIILSENFNTPGTYQIRWNGVDAAGNQLPLGADINFIAAVIFFPVHFPIFDFEQSLGIRITNIRPGNVEDNMIYWDDSNLSTSGLSAGQTASDPRVNVTGVLGPDHTWFATGDNGFGNNVTINTWAASYYTEVQERGFFNFLTIRGNVYTDSDALTDNQVDGTATTASSLYATLISNSTNTVRRVARVAANGTYALNKVGNGSFRILIRADSTALGAADPGTSLPQWWEHTGENLGTGTGHDGVVNGTLPTVTLAGVSLTNANFGIRPILSDPAVVKVVDNSLPEFGSQVTFTITASNNGYSTAQGVQVVESMPNGYSYLSHTVTGGTYNPATKIWDIGSLPVGTTYTLRLRTRVEERSNGNYENNVLILSTTPDSNSNNNTDLAETTPYRLLPVTWLSFRGKALEEHVLLEWATAREKDNKHFVLQRSRNGKDWQDLHKVTGQGTTAEVSTYQTTDGRPMLGDNYYRLSQVDFQGGSSVSEVIRIHFEPGWTISAYPNPFTEQVHIEAKDLDEFLWGVYDVSGRQIPVPVIDSSPSYLQLDFSKQPAGIYHIRLSNTQKILTKRIIKG